MPHPAPCITQLADDIENHGNMLALLTDVSSKNLSPRGRIGLIQLSSAIIQEFEAIELNLKRYRASLTPNC
ncbi:hypothetical protein ACIZ1P_19300 [Pseudomonas guariconensis]|uniref:hypothetical protein n=1 Tax=Pseudomonas guariconensis TaxID=1288410 RepID=UPI003F68D91E